MRIARLVVHNLELDELPAAPVGAGSAKRSPASAHAADAAPLDHSPSLETIRAAAGNAAAADSPSDAPPASASPDSAMVFEDTSPVKAVAPAATAAPAAVPVHGASGPSAHVPEPRVSAPDVVQA
jgi:hypothetical protein